MGLYKIWAVANDGKYYKGAWDVDTPYELRQASETYSFYMGLWEHKQLLWFWVRTTDGVIIKFYRESGHEKYIYRLGSREKRNIS